MERQQMTKSLFGRRILLTEDNVLNTEIAVEILSNAGCIVETAENGKQAYEMVCTSRPDHYDLILMDIQMPIMDGYEATQAIRSIENPALAKIPIIALTTNSSEEDRKKAFESGMNAYATKPIDVQKLFDTIRQTLCTGPSSKCICS
jgi:CheY-like chemotaxis protein